MEKIMLIGGGKLSYAMVQGFLNVGIPKESLVVVCRSDASRTKFVDLDVPTMRNVNGSHLEKYKTIFIAVRPQDAGGAIEILKDARSEFKPHNMPENNIISLVSGLTIGMLSEYAYIHPKYITCATMSTNVAKNCGLIAYTKFETNKTSPEEILRKLGEVQFFSAYRDILMRVTTIGSMNALDLYALDKIYEFGYSDNSFKKFISHMVSQLELSVSNMDGPVQKYIEAKLEALKTFSPQLDIAKNLATTLKSSVFYLEKSGVTAKEHLETVLTPNGCTERGIKLLGDTLTSKSIRDFLNIVHKRAKHFSTDVENSIFETKLEKKQKTQSEAIKKIYGKEGSFVKFPC